jgi:hypothetical protein
VCKPPHYGEYCYGKFSEWLPVLCSWSHFYIWHKNREIEIGKIKRMINIFRSKNGIKIRKLYEYDCKNIFIRIFSRLSPRWIKHPIFYRMKIYILTIARIRIFFVLYNTKIGDCFQEHLLKDYNNERFK